MLKKLMLLMLMLGLIVTPLSVTAALNYDYLNTNEVEEILSSPELYLNWLKTLTYEGTEEVIEEFLSLSTEDQYLFLRMMHPENIEAVMDVSNYAIGTIGYVLIDNEEVSFAVVDDKNSVASDEFPIVVLINYEETPIVDFTRNAIVSRELNTSYSHNLVGIAVTSFSANFRFHVYSNTLRPHNAVAMSATHRNWNPAVIVNSLRENQFMLGGRAYGTATWRVNLTLAAGAISHDRILEVRRNGTLNQSRMQSPQGVFSAWRNL